MRRRTGILCQDQPHHFAVDDDVVLHLPRIRCFAPVQFKGVVCEAVKKRGLTDATVPKYEYLDGLIAGQKGGISQRTASKVVKMPQSALVGAGFFRARHMAPDGAGAGPCAQRGQQGAACHDMTKSAPTSAPYGTTLCFPLALTLAFQATDRSSYSSLAIMASARPRFLTV